MEDKSDYKKGLLYFCYLMICLCLYITTPDGDNLFYKFIGLFGISPGIKLGNSTLYIYMIAPLILAVLCIKKIMKYWWKYGVRFKEYNFFLRNLPVIIFIPVFLFSSNIISPKLSDQLYYYVLGQNKGLKAITYTSVDNLEYTYEGDTTTYSYNITFENHGNEELEFYISLSPFSRNSFEEIFIKDDNGDNKLFTIYPKQRVNFTGEFNEYKKTSYGSLRGGGNGIFSVTLINGEERYSPKRIVR